MNRLTIWAMMAVLGVLACAAPQSEYQAATVAYNAEAVRYGSARSVIVDGAGDRRQGVVTDAQWSTFRADEAAVIAADAAVYADLRTWARTGVKPSGYDANAAALAAAQQRIITLSSEVN